MKQVARAVDLSDRKVASALHRLEDVGAIETLPTGEVQLAAEVDIDEVARSAAERQHEHKENRREKLEQMQNYAEAATCRREVA
jgi:ATP-dependent DNA helicase RecQ